jgi:hypothetical protein
MKMIKLLAILCMISAISIAAGEKVELGPASVSLNLNGLGSCIVEKGDPSSMDHKKPDFQYSITPANIKIDGSSNIVQIEVHKMSCLEPLLSSISRKDPTSSLEHCIEKSDMIPVGEDIQTEPYTIDGKQGLLTTLDSSSKNPTYIVAYSPDEESGSGTVVCIIGSNLPWESTKSIFDSVETKLT